MIRAAIYQDNEVYDSFAHDLLAESSSTPVDTLQTASSPARLCKSQLFNTNNNDSNMHPSFVF